MLFTVRSAKTRTQRAHDDISDYTFINAKHIFLVPIMEAVLLYQRYLYVECIFFIYTRT